MKILALDISMRSGFALFEDSILIDAGKILDKESISNNNSQYPYNFLSMAEEMAERLFLLVKKNRADVVVIEETNKATERFSQKKLEFIHCCLAFAFRSDNFLVNNIYYIDSSLWRKTINLKLSKEDRQHNNMIRSERKRRREELHLEITNNYELDFIKESKHLTKKREINKVRKKFDTICKKECGKQMAKFRVKVGGTVMTEINKKTLAVAFANKQYNLQLRIGDNDIADAICLGYAFIVGALDNVK